MRRRFKRALVVLAASALAMVGLQSPALATTWADCTYSYTMQGGAGCFIKTGDDVGARDEAGDGYHVRVWWKVYPTTGGMLYDYCEAFYGETHICDYNFPSNAQFYYSVGILDYRDGATWEIRRSGWFGPVSVGG